MRFNRKKFFDGVKDRIDPTLNQGQVDGFELSRQVFPRRTFFDMSDGTPSDIIIVGDSLMSSGVLQNGQHLYFSQFGIRRFTVGVSVVIHHILSVIRMRAHFQMIWVYARRIITYIMANKLSIRNVTYNGLIHQAMSEPELALKIKSPVAHSINASRPQPTVVRFFHERHQAFKSRTAFLSGLITFIRAKLTILMGGFLKCFSTTNARQGNRRFTCFKFTLIRTIQTARVTKWAKRNATFLTGIVSFESLVSHRLILAPIKLHGN